MRRREFLELCGLSASLPAFLPGLLTAANGAAVDSRWQADVIIVGGGLGGCAAALAAARAGCRVILTEETDWIGGQLTSQAVPPDEHRWIEKFGCTRSYRALRDGIRDYYRRHYPLTADARGQVHLNPGGGGVSRVCHEPRVALGVLESMLAPFVSSGRVRVLLQRRVTSADAEHDRIRAVVVDDVRGGHPPLVLEGQYFLDATELGDLLPLSGTEYITGFESQSETGEPRAPSEAQPANMQACTWCFALDWMPDETHLIERPAEYDFWRDYVPQMTPPWPGPLLAWHMSHPRDHRVRPVGFDPSGASLDQRLNLWLYRRITSRNAFEPGTFDSDVTLVNWPQNDYWLGNLFGTDVDEVQRHWLAARQLSLSLLYWMQTEAPRDDGGVGWSGLRLRGDLVGTEHGLAKYPYVRESRRIQAEFTVCEQHVGVDARMKETGKPRNQLAAARFDDSVGIGHYNIDLHPSTGGDNYIDVGSLPFQIPAGALIPQRMENLLPACKNLGTTHITNGCYRLHPVEWNIGEAAGALAAMAVQENLAPRAIRQAPRHLQSFQKRLLAQGFELEWPAEVQG